MAEQVIEVREVEAEEPQGLVARILARASERRRPSPPPPKDEVADARDLERGEKIKATAIEMMELSRGRCRQLTEEGKFEAALTESEEAGYWWDRITGRGEIS